MRRILFVHDDVAVLKTLKDALQSAGGGWEVECSATIPDGLDRLGRGAFDVVVAGAGVRDLPGGSFLDRAAVCQPRAVRFLLSNGGSRGMLVRAGGAAHQEFATPGDVEATFERLESTLALGDMLDDTHLKGVISRLKAVPSLPAVYVAIMTELRQAEPSAGKVGELVSKDAGMSAKLLQLVNSPFFSIRMRVTDPGHAVRLLGLETVRALVLSLHIFQQFDERTVLRFRLGRVWRHSLAAAGCARLIGRLRNGTDDPVGEATTASVLHDIGKLVLASSLKEEYAAALELAEQSHVTQWEAEWKVMRATHAEVGAYLLGLWGLPESIVQAVAWHHRPSQCPSTRFGPLGVVHAAECIEHEMHPDDVIGAPPAADAAYMDRFSAAWHYPAWRAACLDADGTGLGRGLAARL